jgi:hypothetical protein
MACVEQDRQLDELSRVIGRQKEIGLTISDELDYQVDLLQQTEERIDDTDQRLARARRRLDQVLKKANDKRMFMRSLTYLNIDDDRMYHVLDHPGFGPRYCRHCHQSIDFSYLQWFQHFMKTFFKFRFFTEK